MQILSRAVWGAVPPKSRTPIAGVVGWVTHWVGGSGMFAVPTLQQTLALMRSLQAAAMAGLHGDVYVDFEYNFAVDPVGRILEGRGWGIESGANGTTSANGHDYSVVYLAGPGVPLTAAAKQALLWLTQEGARRYPTLEVVEPHDEVPGDSTGCPGPDLTPFSAVLNAHLHDPLVPIVKVKPMFDPPFVMRPWRCKWTNPDGSVKVAVGDDWSVYEFGVPPRLWPTRAQDTAGRIPARVAQAAGLPPGRYTITAKTGETYTP